MSVAPLGYDTSGAVMACGDGPELVVYGNDVPIWKQFCEGILVGVGVVGNRAVISVDTDGRVVTWRALDGLKQREVRLEAETSDLAVAPDGVCAAITERGLALVSGVGDATFTELSGLCCLAFGESSDVLGLGYGDGRFEIRHVASGAVLGTVEIGHRVTGVAYGQGRWLVSAGEGANVVGSSLLAADPKASALKQVTWSVLQRFDLLKPVALAAISEDGVVGAVVVEARRVVLLDLYGKKELGEVVLDRDVNALVAGPQAWLAIGLDGGDANRLDVATGSLTRTQSGLGRKSDPWHAAARVDTGAVRASKLQVRAGGAPVAKQIEHAPPGIMAGFRQEEGGRSWWPYLLGCGALVFLCGGGLSCAGVGAYFYF